MLLESCHVDTNAGIVAVFFLKVPSLHLLLYDVIITLYQLIL